MNTASKFAGELIGTFIMCFAGIGAVATATLYGALTALTDKGWVVIEGNRRAQFGWQYSFEGGARPEIEGYLKRLHKKN